MASIGNHTDGERYQLFINNITLQSLATLVNNNAQVKNEHVKLLLDEIKQNKTTII